MAESVNETLTPDDSDLVYDGRARKRPSGASDLTQRIYMLLHDHPEGLSVDEIHAVLAEGWLDTDYYRAYEQSLSQRTLNQMPYGSTRFKERAQRRAITNALSTMKQPRHQTAHCTGGRWFKGARAPRITIHESKPRYITHDWAAERRNAYRADTADRVKREQLRAEAWQRLHDGRVRGAAREFAQHVYDYLTGN